MLDNPRHDWSRLQARTRVIEERRLLATRGLGPQPLDIPILLHRYIVQQRQPLYC
jgi:hypothetical protein